MSCERVHDVRARGRVRRRCRSDALVSSVADRVRVRRLGELGGRQARREASRQDLATDRLAHMSARQQHRRLLPPLHHLRTPARACLHCDLTPAEAQASHTAAGIFTSVHRSVPSLHAHTHLLGGGVRLHATVQHHLLWKVASQHLGRIPASGVAPCGRVPVFPSVLWVCPCVPLCAVCVCACATAMLRWGLAVGGQGGTGLHPPLHGAHHVSQLFPAITGAAAHPGPRAADRCCCVRASHLPAACLGSTVPDCSSARRICPGAAIFLLDIGLRGHCITSWRGAEAHLCAAGESDRDSLVMERDRDRASANAALPRPHTFFIPAISAHCSISRQRCSTSAVTLARMASSFLAPFN